MYSNYREMKETTNYEFGGYVTAEYVDVGSQNGGGSSSGGGGGQNGGGSGGGGGGGSNGGGSK